MSEGDISDLQAWYSRLSSLTSQKSIPITQGGDSKPLSCSDLADDYINLHFCGVYSVEFILSNGNFRLKTSCQFFSKDKKKSTEITLTYRVLHQYPSSNLNIYNNGAFLQAV